MSAANAESNGTHAAEHHASSLTVLKVLGTFNLLLLAACAWANWRTPQPLTSPIMA
jgi:hypothetical protein